MENIKKYIYEFFHTYKPWYAFVCALVLIIITILYQIEFAICLPDFIINASSLHLSLLLLILTCCFIFTYKLSLKTLILCSCFNGLDIFLIHGFLCSISAAMVNWTFAFLLLGLVFLGIITVRLKIFNISKVNSKSIYLSNLINNDFTHKKEEPLIINDGSNATIEYGRSRDSEYICKLIRQYEDDSNFVILINGEWGTGKSSLLLNVKKELSDEVNFIDENYFNPWLCSSKKSFLLSMCDSILGACGCKPNVFTYKHVIEVAEKFLSEYRPFSGLKALIDDDGEYMCSNELNLLLSQQTRRLTKTIVFSLDNIDRLNDEQILFMLQSIKTVFNIPNLIIILSFSEKNVLQIYERNGIPSEYLQKIYNVKHDLYLSKCNALYSIIYHSFVYAILSFDSSLDLANFKIIINLLYLEIDNFRKLILYLNTVINETFLFNDLNLSARDLLFLNTVKFFDIDLYKSILDNRKFYISSDYGQDFESSINRDFRSNDEFNEKAKNYFNLIFKEFPKYVKCLKEIFPNAERAASNTQIKPEGIVRDKLRNLEIERDKPIYSGRYFDNYIDVTSNIFSNINKYVKEMISLINGEEKNYKDLINDYLLALNYSVQAHFLVMLDNLISTIDIDKLNSFSTALVELNSSFQTYKNIFELSAQDRCEIFIASAIIELINYDNKKFQLLDFLCTDCSYLNFLHGVEYWLTSDSKLLNGVTKTLVDDAIKTCHDKAIAICDDIIDKNINMFLDDYFSFHNVWGFTRYMYDEQREYKKYVSSCLDDETVLNFAYDLLEEEVTNDLSYAYRVHEGLIKELDINIADVWNLLSKINVSNKYEEIVTKAWSNFNDTNKEKITTDTRLEELRKQFLLI